DFSRDAAMAEGAIEPDRIRTIHLQLTPAEAAASGGALSRLGVSRDAYLIYPANFWRHKNHEMLLTAFGLACRAGLDSSMKLVLTGAPGERQEWIRRAARELGLAERIVFAGFVSEADLATLMAG